MTIYKNISDGKLYIIYKGSNGDFTAIPNGKVTEDDKILKNCQLKDFVVHSFVPNKITGFI